MKIKLFILMILLNLCFMSIGLAQGKNTYYENFKSIPVFHDGRLKPLDSYARHFLIQLSGKDTYDHAGAIVWLSRVLFAPQEADNDKVILINNPDIAVLLNIPAEEHRRYSFAEFKPVIIRLLSLESAVVNINEQQRSLEDNELIRVAENVKSYINMAYGDQGPFLQNNIGPTNLLHKLWQQMSEAYKRGDLAEFEMSARQYGDAIKADLKPQEARIVSRFPLELSYNSAMPFMWAKVFYITAFIFFIISFASSGQYWYGLGLFSVVAGFMFHALGIAARMIIMGRPPIADLYETFIFASFITVLLGLGIEYFNRRWLGIMTAAICGAVLLFMAGRYSSEGDTFKMLTAVLNSNFWLGTHVITITMGYGAACVVGVLGHVWLIQAVLNKDKEMLDNTFKMILGTMGLALTFTFLGTNLGGIWADQTWGRFWGWDPKENGALMIILWFAILFHAKYAGMIGPRGLAVGSVVGLMVVMWAWLGVNLLGIGLHSYGFTSGLANALAIYVACEIAFIVFSCIFIYKNKSRQ